MDNRTATESIMAQNEKAIEENIINRRIEHFHKNYLPEDRQLAVRFATDLHELVRAIYGVAQEPAHQRLVQIVNAIPFMPLNK